MVQRFIMVGLGVGLGVGLRSSSLDLPTSFAWTLALLGVFTWTLALRVGFLTLMAANWPLIVVNVFLVGYGAPCLSMVWPQHSCGNGH